jgi:hypothetical protein
MDGTQQTYTNDNERGGPIVRAYSTVYVWTGRDRVVTGVYQKVLGQVDMALDQELAFLLLRAVIGYIAKGKRLIDHI